jgi:hypothetical protein
MLVFLRNFENVLMVQVPGSYSLLAERHLFRIGHDMC